MTNYRKRLGALGETIAADYLSKLGYTVLERNYRCSLGEIDIVTTKGDYLVFVEVRARRNLEFGLPEESVTTTKCRKLMALAEAYIQKHERLPANWRIDVVALEFAPDRSIKRITLIENAVSQV